MSSGPRDPVASIPKPSSNLSKSVTSPEASGSGSGSGSDSNSEDEPQTFHDASTHFSHQDEAALLSESNATKSEANTLFSQQRYSEAISIYDRALASCPNYLDYEVAVLKSNISACHLQLEEWKAAVDSATEALDGLERLDPLPKEEKEKGKEKAAKTPQQQNSVKKATRGVQDDRDKPDVGDVVEIPDSEDESTALHRLSLSDARRKDISRIRLKSLLRRARARHRQATWASLAGADEDYRLLLSMLTATPSSAHSPRQASQSDLATVKSALRTLPAEINSAKEKEMGEMMGKLKELGNGILKPFGLSTDNFKMVKDEKSGGYSMNFEGGGKK